MKTSKRSFLAGLLAAGVATAVSVPAMAQQRTEIQFWHAMGGVLGERVDEIVADVVRQASVEL